MPDAGLTLADRYTLVSLVARGGMGEVWAARDTVLGRRVAVKLLLPNLAGDPGFAARFRAEAQAMAALSDPGIVEVYDYGQTGALAYLVMQFVDGESLHTLLNRAGPLTPERTMGLLAQAAHAIHAAHGQGIVHRDVKPGNLLLRPDGRLVLTDFGIARIVAADRLTAVDEILGTSSYLAPEQVTGDQVSPATDVYALGVVAYELLTRRKPFTGETPLSIAMQHVHDAPPPLPDSVPEPVRDLVMRALAKDPAERWPSAAALAHAATLARTAAPAVPEPDPPTGRRGRPLLLAAGLALVLAIGAGYAVTLGRTGDPETGQADPPASAAAPATSAPAASVTATPRLKPAGGATPTGGPSTVPGAPRSTGAPSSAASNTSPEPSGSPASTTRTVPPMYGWSESEAVSELERLGLVPRVTRRLVVNQCYVIGQTPAGGTAVKAGSTVDITVATPLGACDKV